MGISCDSILIYGVKIRDIVTEIKVKTFEHDFPPHYKVNPVTGTPLYRTKYTHSLDTDKIYELCNGEKCGYVQTQYDGNEYIIGKILSVVGENETLCNEMNIATLSPICFPETVKIIKNDFGLNPDDMKLYHVYRMM